MGQRRLDSPHVCLLGLHTYTPPHSLLILRESRRGSVESGKMTIAVSLRPDVRWLQKFSFTRAACARSVVEYLVSQVRCFHYLRLAPFPRNPNGCTGITAGREHLCVLWVAQTGSQMPRHLISDAHEWINEIPTVPIYYLAKPQPRERTWENQRGKKTLLSLTLVSYCGEAFLA